MRQPQAPFYDPRQHQSNGASGERYIHLQLHKQKQTLTLGYIQNDTSPERQRCKWDLAVEPVIWVALPAAAQFSNGSTHFREHLAVLLPRRLLEKRREIVQCLLSVACLLVE
jgi:hypothetical protein